MGFVVVYDASVLYPSTLRDLLIRIAQSGLVQAKWTAEILDEMFAALRRQRPNLDVTRLERTRALMATIGTSTQSRRTSSCVTRSASIGARSMPACSKSPILG